MINFNITTDYIPKAITGDKLIESLNATEHGRVAIAEGLIYEDTMLMIAAEPGCGKSTVAIQVAVELAAGLPVFGFFPVAKPVKVLYIQWERSALEVFERLKVISNSYPITKENLYITDEYQKLDLTKHYDVLIKCIQRDCPDVKLIFIDPIYSTMIGGIKDDKSASMFTHIMSKIQKTIGCSLWYNHHVVKQQYASDGSKIEKDDPFYGSQWLKAHVTGSYYMKSTENGVIMQCKKDNYSVLTKSIELDYNPNTNLVYLNSNELHAIDKFKNFLRSKSYSKKSFTFSDIQAETQLCTRKLRQILCTTEIKDMLLEEKANRNKTIYRIKEQKNA